MSPVEPRLRWFSGTLLRVVIIGFAAVLSVAGGGLGVAHGDDAAKAKKAGDYLVSQLVSGDHLEGRYASEFLTAEAIIALSALGDSKYDAQISAMSSWLALHATNYMTGETEETGETTDPAAAARLALAVSVTGEDSSSFGGVNLQSSVKNAFAADGTFSTYPSPYRAALGILAMVRTGQPVQATAVAWLSAQANSDGSYAYEKNDAADAEVTAMVITAFASLSNRPAYAQKALDNAVAWAKKAAKTDGSWTSTAPVGGTALLAAALTAAGVDQSKAKSYLSGAQLSNGGFPAEKGSKAADLLVTTQAILAFTDKTYLTIGKGPSSGKVVGTATMPSTGKATSSPKSTSTSKSGTSSPTSGDSSSDPQATATSTATAGASVSPIASPGASSSSSLGPNGEFIGPTVPSVSPSATLPSVQPGADKGATEATIADGPNWLDVQMPVIAALVAGISIAFVLIRIRDVRAAARARRQPGPSAVSHPILVGSGPQNSIVRAPGPNRLATMGESANRAPARPRRR